MIYLYSKPCFHECQIYDGPLVALSVSWDDAFELLEQIQACLLSVSPKSQQAHNLNGQSPTEPHTCKVAHMLRFKS